MRRIDTLILGGGPAGSATAITLARAGEKPTLYERQSETGDALCGGFLSWHSLAVADRLGVTLTGHKIDEVRLFARNGCATARLPRPALGLSRRQLDSALLAQAEKLGAQVERGVQARELNGTAIRLGESWIGADRLVLATGKYDLRGAGRLRPAHDPTLGLRLRLPPGDILRKMVGKAIELHLFDRGYAGLVLQEDGSSNLCLVVRKSRLTEEGGTPGLIAAIGRELPALGERLASASDSETIDAIGAVPYGWRAHGTSPGVYRIGDQAAVIPSLAGEGMGIALASGEMAGQAIMRGDSSQTFQRALGARTWRPMAIAQTVLAAAERRATAPMLVAMMRSAPTLATLIARLTRVGH